MSNKLKSNVSSDSLAVPMSAGWERSFLFGIGFIILVRLLIWYLFIGADSSVREDFSNLIVAALQSGLGVAFFFIVWLRKEMVYSTGFEWPLGLLFLAASGTLFYSVDFSMSLRLWLTLVGNMAMFYILVSILKDTRSVKLFLYFILACAFLTALFGIKDFIVLSHRIPQSGDVDIAQYNRSLYYLLTHNRATSFLGWPNSLAGYLFLILPFSGVVVMTARQRWWRVALAVVFLTLLACLLLTYSFLGWLSFSLASGIMLLVLYKQYILRLGIRQKVGVAVAVLVFIILFLLVINSKDFGGSAATRFEYYAQAWHLLGLKPWLGYGYGTFGIASRSLVESANALTNYVHNAYLQWWVECGLAGFLGMLSLVGVFVVASYRLVAIPKVVDKDYLRITVTWGLLTFFIDNAFSFTFNKPNIALHAWVMLAVFAALYKISDSKKRSPRKNVFILYTGALVCVCSLVMSVILLSAVFLLHKGLGYFYAGNLNAAGPAFVTGSLWDRWSSSYPVSAGNAAVRAYLSSGEGYYLDLAESNFLEAIRREPLEYSSYLILSKIYSIRGDREKALNFVRDARRLSPYECMRDMRLSERRRGSVVR